MSERAGNIYDRCVQLYPVPVPSKDPHGLHTGRDRFQLGLIALFGACFYGAANLARPVSQYRGVVTSCTNLTVPLLVLGLEGDLNPYKEELLNGKVTVSTHEVSKWSEDSRHGHYVYVRPLLAGIAVVSTLMGATHAISQLRSQGVTFGTVMTFPGVIAGVGLLGYTQIDK